MKRRLTAVVEREGDGYVALCSDLDVASQGATVAEARDNLFEALTLFFETASTSEIDRLLKGRFTHCQYRKSLLAKLLVRPGRDVCRIL